MPSVQTRGRFLSFTEQGEGAKSRLVGLFSDGSGTMDVVWFRRTREIRKAYRVGTEYVLFGQPRQFNRRWSMVHPEIDLPQAITASVGLRGVYPITEALGVDTKFHDMVGCGTDGSRRCARGTSAWHCGKTQSHVAERCVVADALP